MPTISSVGPKPSSSSSRIDWLVVGEVAVIVTCSASSSALSCVLFQKAGTWVANSAVGVAVFESAG